MISHPFTFAPCDSFFAFLLETGLILFFAISKKKKAKRTRHSVDSNIHTIWTAAADCPAQAKHLLSVIISCAMETPVMLQVKNSVR